jgi:pimeloyl-ACP methyl ester carboxylesterase
MAFPALTEFSIEANGLRFGCLTCGPEETVGETSRPLALCLHGFPDSAWTWRHLLPDLAEAGYRPVAPFLRGYAPTDIPADGRYQTGALVADVCALHDALGGDERAALIGHDWGALAAYGAAAFQPKYWDRVVTAAVPHPGSLAGGFFTYSQLHRSWYMFFFQHPLADGAVAMNDMEFIDHLWADWSPGYDASEDLPRVKAALNGLDRITAALGYYRATLNFELQVPELAAEQAAASAITPQPTLYLHGADDGCMAASLAEGSLQFFGPGSELDIVPGVGHFLHVEKPAEINRRIIDFLTASTPV